MQESGVKQDLYNLMRFSVALVLVMGLCGTAAFLLFGTLSGAFGNALFLVAVCAPVLACVKGFERKHLSAVGLTARGRDLCYFFLGVLWAGVWLTVVLAIICQLTGKNDFLLAVRQLGDPSRVLRYLMIGFCEELLCRGYLFQNLFCEWPFWRRSFLSAVLFMLLHGWNAGGDPAMLLISALLFGLLANRLVFRTGSIWMGVGLHWMWNMLAVSYFYDQGTQSIALPMFPLVLLISFPLLELLLNGLQGRLKKCA